MSTPAVVTFAMMYEELQEIKKTLKALTKNTLTESIQEISLSQTSKLLKLGREHVIRQIKEGNLKARVYKDAKGRERYRIRLIDLKEFQEYTRVNEEAVKARLEQEKEAISVSRGKASGEYIEWAKAEVERRRLQRERKQQQRKGVK